jgi:signal transduction histidine kinase
MAASGTISTARRPPGAHGHAPLPMAQSMLRVPMGTPATASDAAGSDRRDLVRFNRWLCVTRVRAAGGVLAFGTLLHWFGVGDISMPYLAAVCGGLFAVSLVGLRSHRLAAAPRLFFYLQTLADLAGATLGIAFAAHGIEALLFRSVYAVIIVPASLISVSSGLVVAAAATVGHETLLAWEHGLSLATLGSVESLTPSFLFFLLAQQCFFYGEQLKRKNGALAGLATRLEESHHQLVSEARTSAALLDVARTLGSTLDAPELLDRVNATTRTQLDADWTGTFLVDVERGTFRLVAVTDTDAASSELGRLELPMRGWSPVGRLVGEPVVVLTGTDAERTPGLFASGRCLSTVILAALYRDDRLAGFLAVGFATLEEAERARVAQFLTGIAQHATIVRRNVRLLEDVRLASAMKSEFVGAVSHELRSPLNVILGYLEMLLDNGLGAVTAEQADALRRTQQQALALLEMITALLDMNRLEAGRLPVQRTRVVPKALLEEICRQLPESWRRPEVTLQLAVAPDVPTIETDAGKLKTVIRNLLHNALKFTTAGQVTVGAGTTAGGGIVIRVSDTGRGIPPDAIKYIFDMFRQVPGADGGGVGLGLHLVRRLLQLLGGSISVTSEVGKGTCFTITLPPAPDGGEPESARPRARPSATAHAA